MNMYFSNTIKNQLIEEGVVIEEYNTLKIDQEIMDDEEIDSDFGGDPALQDETRPERSPSLVDIKIVVALHMLHHNQKRAQNSQ